MTPSNSSSAMRSRAIRSMPAVLFSVAATFSALLLAMPLALADALDILGEWRTPAGLRIQVHKCGDIVCARIVRMPDPSITDSQNPEPRLRTRPVLGIEIFTGLRPAGTSGWKGHMYVPETGGTYVSRLISQDRGHLKASTCGPMGFFCTQETWLRTR